MVENQYEESSASGRVGRPFVIVSLPRSGSTTLARLVNSHKDLRCLIEPFHPMRYEGQFHRLAIQQSLDVALEFIWNRWNGFKHVWESNGWPFPRQAALNDQIVSGPGLRVLFIVRRNLLRRIVSNVISRQTRYWMGTREEFEKRLEHTPLRELDPALLREQIRRDEYAIGRRLQSFADSNSNVMTLYYEDLFSDQASPDQQLQSVNRIFEFLGAAPVDEELFAAQFRHHFDPSVNRWASAEVYRRIPEIERVEKEVGSDRTGWLFQ